MLKGLYEVSLRQLSSFDACRRQVIPLLPCLFEKLTHRRVKAESPASVRAESDITGSELGESRWHTQALPEQRSKRVAGRDKPEERMSFLSEQACPGQ
jgi:hypothetical protein